MPKRDIVERLRDGKIDIAYRDRLIAASEIERLRAALREIILNRQPFNKPLQSPAPHWRGKNDRHR
jgi:hypothetical protein